MIVTICASYKFKEEMMDVYRVLTEKGGVVLLPAFNCSNHPKEWYMELHKKKIKMSDAVYILNKNNYIGEAVTEELNYAKSLGKAIMYHE